MSLGLLGKIESPFPNCKTTFKCISSWSPKRFISVDYFKGTLKLKRNPWKLPKRPSGIRKLTPPLKIKIRGACQHGRVYKYVTVNLLVFPSKFGDASLSTYNHRRKLARMVKENQKFDAKSGMANSLHRIMRMVTKKENPGAVKEMMASVKVKTGLEAAINKILTKYVTKNPGNNKHLTLTYETRQFLL